MNVFSLRNREYAIERVPFLLKKFPESQQILEFYREILRFQLQLYVSSKNENWHENIKKFYDLLELCVDSPSAKLSEVAQSLLKEPPANIQRMINNFLKEKMAKDEERFFFISFLNPFLSKKAEKDINHRDDWNKSKCPVCGFRAVVSYISDTEEVQGGRFLVCQVCNSEWLYNRTTCVKCGNNDDDRIHHFFDQSIPYIQLQACESCGTYIKIVDMRMDGLAVPLLEDIASVALDLWAKEHLYEKYEKNIFGL